jgi:hypothetical protein
VKINDKAALEKYSTIEYNKKIDKSKSYGIGKIVNFQNTYIGIKITKPDGKEQIISPDEEVLIKNEAKNQQGKLAVPGLQTGDIIDYYISTASVTEDPAQINKDSDFFLYLADEYPILSYHLGFQYNKKTQLSYVSANGAPQFIKTTNADGDQILTLDFKNIPKYNDLLWTSPARQYPYIALHTMYESKYNNALMGVKNENKDKKLSNLDNDLVFMKENAYNEVYNPIYTRPQDYLKKYFDSKKALKAAPLDSSMSALYDAWRYSAFCFYNGKDFDMDDKKYSTARSLSNAVDMSRMLADMEIDHELLIVGARNSNSLQNYLQGGDCDGLIKINGSKPLYMCFDDVVTHFNEIPAKYQGEEAISLKPARESAKKYTFKQGKAIIPVSSADENLLHEQVNVSLLPDNQKVKIKRTVKQSGSMRHASQLNFLLFEDIDKAFTAKFKEDNIEKRLSIYPKTVKNNYLAAFAEARTQAKVKFTNEIKVDYDQEPKLLSDYRVINSAVYSSKPVFEYTSSFVMDNYIKKAGNHYILEVGKLIGTDTKLTDEERNRKIDVYMPAARTIKYDINFTIPKGYKVSGIDELKIQKDNKAGSFTSTASVNNDVLTVSVNRVYKNNFEKVSNWPLLVDILDATHAFSTQKVLLEKQ